MKWLTADSRGCRSSISRIVVGGDYISPRRDTRNDFEDLKIERRCRVATAPGTVAVGHYRVSTRSGSDAAPRGEGWNSETCMLWRLKCYVQRFWYENVVSLRKNVTDLRRCASGACYF